MKTPEEIGKTIRKLRGDLSLRAFAQKCHISHSTIDYIEKGVDFRTGKPSFPSALVLNKIADACDVPLNYILGADEKAPTESELSEGERMLLELFRKVPEEQQPIVLGMIRGALSTKG